MARQPEASKPLFSFKHLIFGSYWLPRLFCLLSESLCLNIASFCGRVMFQRGYYAFRRLRQKWASNTLIINTNARQIASEIIVCPSENKKKYVQPKSVNSPFYSFCSELDSFLRCYCKILACQYAVCAQVT